MEKLVNLGTAVEVKGKNLVFILKNGMKVLLDVNQAARGEYAKKYKFEM